MKRQFILASAFILLHRFGFARNTGVRFGRIYSGHDAYPGQFKYIAMIQALEHERKFVSICGGALIEKKWILTAAHCVDKVHLGPQLSIVVLLGATFEAQPVISIEVASSQVILHPDWNLETKQNDIALMPIPEVCNDHYIAPISLPHFVNKPPSYTGSVATTAGWGHLGNRKPNAGRLQWTRIQVISNFVCNMKFEDVSENEICVNTAFSGGSPCLGDSGGPLVLETTGELIGIVSAMPNHSCENGDPVLCMRVTHYLPWIRAKIDTRN